MRLFTLSLPVAVSALGLLASSMSYAGSMNGSTNVENNDLLASEFTFSTTTNGIESERGNDVVRDYDLSSALQLAWLIEEEKRAQSEPFNSVGEEKYNTGWAFYMDNDVFTPSSTDRDYTGGFSFTLSGRRATEYAVSLQPVLNKINGFTLRRQGSPEASLHSLEFGMTVFTPENIKQEERQENDRPYASLLHISNTEQRVYDNNVAWTSTFSLGALGLDLVADLQTDFHKLIGASEPKGWDQQISNGGELTAKYSLSRQQKFFSGSLNGSNHETSTAWHMNAGYLTDVSWGMATRYGKIRTPWWSFNPQVVEYAEKSVPVKHANSSEFYVWGGFRVKARAYNAFLQGQFKDSEITYSRDDLETVIVEAWAGVTKQLNSGLRFSYVIRGQSKEISEGPAARSSIWGGLIVSQAF